MISNTSQFGSNISSISSKASQFNGFDIQGLFSITTSFADFGKLLNNPISVISKDISQLVGSFGGQFDVIRQLSESAKNINPFAPGVDFEASSSMAA